MTDLEHIRELTANLALIKQALANSEDKQQKLLQDLRAIQLIAQHLSRVIQRPLDDSLMIASLSQGVSEIHGIGNDALEDYETKGEA